MVSTSFASGGRGDDRTVHRTLAVGRYMLDMGYRSMVLANVSSIVIFQPPRVTVGKLFFALFAVLFGAAAGALFYGFSVTWILIGMIVGLVVGILPLIPKPPTSLMITGSDGGAAIFESNDLQFLQRAKAFLDARINQNDLAMTGFFDFTQSRFAPLRQEGEFEDMDQRRDMDQLRGEEPQDTAHPARAPARPAAATQKPARPAPRRESGHDAAAPARPPSRPQPQPAPTATPTPTPTPARPARPSEPALDADIDLSADDVTGHGGKDTGRGRTSARPRRRARARRTSRIWPGATPSAWRATARTRAMPMRAARIRCRRSISRA